jgi:hypothetical protein
MSLIERAKKLVVKNHWLQQGQLAERERIITLFKNSDSASAEWAIGIITGETKSNVYWGCYACGHEVPRDATECWDCEKPRQFAWLNEFGEYAESGKDS